MHLAIKRRSRHTPSLCTGNVSLSSLSSYLLLQHCAEGHPRPENPRTRWGCCSSWTANTVLLVVPNKQLLLMPVYTRQASRRAVSNVSLPSLGISFELQSNLVVSKEDCAAGPTLCCCVSSSNLYLFNPPCLRLSTCDHQGQIVCNFDPLQEKTSKVRGL